ncbi:Adenylate kinase [Zostera marina]|uniref:adenylate kinase n=1 Tax=Zostera marina TaxID=29655 RepID=A0A0K9NIA7_ZOSMR|nr:Adenylate kinase [Zostera marina]
MAVMLSLPSRHFSYLPIPSPPCSSSPSPASRIANSRSCSRLCVAMRSDSSAFLHRNNTWSGTNKGRGQRVKLGLRVSCSSQREPFKIVISGAPASGKGTQCELIVQKYGLVHISTGDLLRAEVSSGTEIGNKAKEFMESGSLVPDDIVTAIVLSRISKPDVKVNGWLLDGYPRTSSQAKSLERNNIKPSIYLSLEVPDEVLIERCIGRRLDPVTGKIYHLKFFPPETEEISSRLITRLDDTEEKVKSRLETYKKNAESVLSTYMEILNKVDGNCSKDIVFEAIDSLLLKTLEDSGNQKNAVDFEGKQLDGNMIRSNEKKSNQHKWKGIPTRMNNIPHSREMRKYFYDDILQATQRAVEDKLIRLKIEINIPELDADMDVYRIGTLMELVRTLALSFAEDGKHVKVCVQGAMGEGALASIPLQLAGSRRILELMDWGNYDAMGTFINIGPIGIKGVDEQDDIFILLAPQNAFGNCIIDDLQALTDAAGKRPVILVNPRLKDLPASNGVMQTIGRDKRMEYAASFQNCYFLRLLYLAGTQYPIMGAIRMSYPYKYELYKRIDDSGYEKYVTIGSFPERPTIDEINDAIDGKSRNKEKKTGFWSFLSGTL